MSLTVGAIISTISTSLSKIAEGALTIIKILAIIGFGSIFAGAILSLIGLLSNVVMTSVIGEFFAIISLCLPFSPAVVFGSILLIIQGVLAFLIAKKIYDLTTDMIGKSS